MADMTACPLCSTVMPVRDYSRHYAELHAVELEAERHSCRACGRPIPHRYLDTAIGGMHPGCHRKATGRRPA